MSTIFTLRGKGLKLDSRADIEPLLNNIDPATVEEVYLGGNTIGVDASVALGEFLKKATKLKVSCIFSGPGFLNRLLINVLADRRPFRYFHRPLDFRNPSRSHCDL
jgi:Ran GTPase-activating protein (RanGAP) involved in mRNA processing and transport